MQIQEDKVLMKQIKVKVVYLGFKEYEVKTDQKRLQQVLLNFFSNAIKFTNKHGNIVILVELKQAEGRQFLRVSVKDDGVGIKEENKCHIFKLFGSIKDKKHKINMQGIGLGLVICKMIVKKFNGSINFLSEYGHGSTFYFSFELEQMKPTEQNRIIKNANHSPSSF
jgi:signal transduction histidine kinase